MNDPDIRLCGKVDLPAVAELLRETWHATYDAIYGVAKVTEISRRWHSLEALGANLSADNSVFLVAERAGVIIGTAFARFDADTATINCDRIYVHPDAQGLGVGYGLLGGLIVRSGPADKVRLEVDPDNGPAIAFYERAGFKVTGRATDCGGQGDDLEHLIMERIL